MFLLFVCLFILCFYWYYVLTFCIRFLHQNKTGKLGLGTKHNLCRSLTNSCILTLLVTLHIFRVRVPRMKFPRLLCHLASGWALPVESMEDKKKKPLFLLGRPESPAAVTVTAVMGKVTVAVVWLHRLLGSHSSSSCPPAEILWWKLILGSHQYVFPFCSSSP